MYSRQLRIWNANTFITLLVEAFSDTQTPNKLLLREKEVRVYLGSHPYHSHLHPSSASREIGLYPSEYTGSHWEGVMHEWSITFLLEEGSSIPLSNRKGMCPDFLSWNTESLSCWSSVYNECKMLSDESQVLGGKRLREPLVQASSDSQLVAQGLIFPATPKCVEFLFCPYYPIFFNFIGV